jgi:hypothetical protein
VRSALEWAQVRALVADGVSDWQIARRLGTNRRTVARLARTEELPRYRRTASGSQRRRSRGPCRAPPLVGYINDLTLFRRAAKPMPADDGGISAKGKRGATIEHAAMPEAAVIT